jgi:hypothetical protein
VENGSTSEETDTDTDVGPSEEVDEDLLGDSGSKAQGSVVETPIAKFELELGHMSQSNFSHELS